MSYRDMYPETRDFGALDSVARFRTFVGDQPCRDGEQVYLADLYKKWLEKGDAVEASGGQFANYLRTCLFIADLVMKDPVEELRFEPFDGSDIRHRQLAGVINPEDPDSSLAFNREYYEAWAFHHVHGRVGVPPNEEPEMAPMTKQPPQPDAV